jgi:hypothetical protein
MIINNLIIYWYDVILIGMFLLMQLDNLRDKETSFEEMLFFQGLIISPIIIIVFIMIFIWQ